jgi:hypothetical protein
MTATVTCPPREELQRLLLGHIRGPQGEALARHLESCERCAALVPGLSAQDSLVEAVRTQERHAEHTERDVIGALMERLTGLRPEPSAVAAAPGTLPTGVVPPLPRGQAAPDFTQELYGFLAPPEASGEMGRLGGYRVLGPLGTGGMGVVFLAEDLRLRRPVALKVLKPELAARKESRQRFLREAQLAAAVKHDHVATVYQVGEERGVPFLAMELLEGESLAARLEREARLPLAEVLRIGREMAEGLAAAHARGLVHRDIKPGNVWLETPASGGPGKGDSPPGERGQSPFPGPPLAGGRVKLLDFGLARSLGDDLHLTRTGMIVGTPSFMAPEQAEGAAVDARSDLFSLGVVLYRMVTGVLPFQGRDALGMLQALATQTPAPARALNPDVPAALSDLIARLLARDPAGRPASAREVADALTALPVPAVPLLPPPRRRRWLVAAALACVAGLVALIVVIIRDRQGREVARVEVPEGGSVEVQGGNSNKSAKAADREKPFELVRDDGKREAFRHLAGALAVLQDGDVIEVHGNGPFTVPSVIVENVRLVLKAAPGYRPKLVAAAPAGLHQGTWLNLHGGAVLEGCDFQASQWHAVLAGSGDWEVRGCRFFTKNDYKFCWYSGRRLRFTDCLLFGCPNTVLEVPARAEVELTNNIIAFTLWPARFLQLARPGGQVVRCKNNTLMCFAREAVLWPEPECTEPIVVEAAGNLFQTGVLVPDDKGAAVLRWKGRDNLYVGPDGLRAAGADGKWAAADLAAWEKRWGGKEAGSRQTAEAPFQLEALQQLPPAQALPIVQAAAEELVRRAHPVTVVWPDWKLIGPGAAYVRARAAEKAERGRSVPRLDRLRPEAPAGGPFVLLRGGKEVRGFLRLQDAFDAAQSGDIIEIRTDGPFPGGVVRGTERDLTLTVRAATGYRPVLSGDIHHEPHKGDFRVEGLSFEEAHLTGAFRNLSVRNSAFYSIETVWNLGCAIHGFGRPVEFRNCIANHGIGVQLDKGRSLLLDNCLAGMIGYEPKEPGELSTVRVRRSALWRPGARGGLFVYRPKNPVVVRAEKSLFVAGAVLGLQMAPGSKWEDKGNLYSIGGPWSAAPTAIGWERPFTADAASQEVPPLLLDPALWQLLPDQPRTSRGREFGADVRRVAR